MPLKLLAAAVLLALTFTTGAAAKVEPTMSPESKANKAERESGRLSSLRTRVSDHRQATWTCQRSLRRPLYRSSFEERHTNSVTYTHYLVKLWAKRHIRCTKARAAALAHARWMRRVAGDAVLSIRYVFGRYASEALRVAQCESGLSRHAHNGQYLGIFQMGSSERRTYGHGDTFLEQAQAAYRYFVASGRDWSPWSCRWAAGY